MNDLANYPQALGASLARGLEERQFRIQRARDCLERTRELFERFGSAELKTALARFGELRGALNADQVRLVVVGEYSRGKSELLNALLGIELLPTAKQTTTAVNTFLQALPVDRDHHFIRIHYQDGRSPDEIPWTDDQAIKRWGTELDASNQDARRLISKIEVFHDHDLLNKGLVLIDTPGLQTIFKHHEEITHRAIAESHVALWLQDAEQLGGTSTEWNFMSRTLRRNFQKFLTVINKWDKVLEPEDTHDKQLGEQERIESKLRIVKNNFSEKLGSRANEEIARLTDPDHLFGVSARWGRDPDPVRRQRSNIDRLAQRIAEMVTSGEAQEQIVLKPLTQLADIQSQLANYIDSERDQLDADTSAEARAQELQRLDLEIREIQQKEKLETSESHDEHERAARVMSDAIRDQLLKPLTSLRDSIADQVTESYVRRMVADRVAKIGLPEELDLRYKNMAAQLDQAWRGQKEQLRQTLDGLRADYLDAMNKHAGQIESNLGQVSIRLPELALALDFDFSALEDHRRRSAQLNGELERLNDELDSFDTEIASNAIDERKRIQAEANLTRVQRQLESLGPPPSPLIREKSYTESAFGDFFPDWLFPTRHRYEYEDDSNVKRYESERAELRETERGREATLQSIQEEEFQRTKRRISLETARKKLDRQMAQKEKALRAAEQKARQDEETLIQDTLKRLHRETTAKLTEIVETIERYLADTLRQLFMDQAQMLAACVQEQMLEPLNARRAQQQEIQTLLEQDQAQIAARRAELGEGRQALAEVQALTHTALTV